MARKNRKKKVSANGAATSGTMATNRRVRFDYHLLDDFEAGLVLKGSEIKSIRDGKIDISNAYVRVTNGEAWLVNAYIAPYQAAGVWSQHEPLRERKLLLHRREIEFLRGRIEQERLTVVVQRVYIVRGVAKVAISLARGKRHEDRRETIKRRDQERDMARALRR
ncbi:MAG: SsrA-binding protein SmpB [Chloroflexi bacterium]|nr:SsrA-binding protein SmpB [Chloroflexota bacterium]